VVELEVWYDQTPQNDYSESDPAIIIRTVAELDALIERVLDETKDHRCPAMIEVSITGTPLPVLEVGLGQEKGFIKYHAEDGGTTKGKGDPTENVEYVSGGTLSEVSADVEVDIQTVRQGLVEFLTTGARPTATFDVT